MKKHSKSVLALNGVSTVTSGLGLFAIAKTMPQLADVPILWLALLSMAGTAIIQAFINNGWRPFFLRTEYSGAVIGGLATTASFVSACAGWLMLFDAGGLQLDLQAKATGPHVQVMQEQEQKYLIAQTTLATLSTQMAQKSKQESTTGPACDNDSTSNWKNICGPRCRYMKRAAALTADMSTASRTLAQKMSALAIQMSSGSQADMDASYNAALALPQSIEAAQLRNGIASIKADLTGDITDPDTSQVFTCKMNSTVALVTQAETELSRLMTMPPRPTRPEPKIEDALTAAFTTAKAMLDGQSSDLRASERVSFWLAMIVEAMLLLMLRRDALQAIRQGTEQLEPEEVDAAKPRKKLHNPDKVRNILGLLDSYTLNGGRHGRFFAVPYDGNDSAFRTRCLEVVDYLKLVSARKASSAVDMRIVAPEWVTSRAGETGEAAHYELYEWPSRLDLWRRFMRRNATQTP